MWLRVVRPAESIGPGELVRSSDGLRAIPAYADVPGKWDIDRTGNLPYKDRAMLMRSSRELAVDLASAWRHWPGQHHDVGQFELGFVCVFASYIGW